MQPAHHMEEIFRSLFVSFGQRFVAEVAYLVTVGDFHKALWLADDFYSVDAFAEGFLELFDCFVEDIALAYVDFLLWLWLEFAEELVYDFGGLSKVFFLAECSCLKILHVYNVIAERLRFVSIGADDDAIEQIAAASIIHRYCHLTLLPFLNS